MRPARRLAGVAALMTAWGALVVSIGVGATWGQTTEPTGPAVPPAAADPTPHVPAPEPGDGKGFCAKNPFTHGLCGVVDAAKDFANGDLPGAAGAVAGGVVAPVVSAATDNVASAITNWVADGARTVLGWLGNLVDGTTTPHLEAEWFRSHYRAMVALAGLVVLPLLISSILGAIVHQDPGRLIRTVFGYLPMAGIFTAGAVSLVILGLKITDDLSAWVGAGSGAAAGDFLGKAGAALSVVGTNPGGQFLVFLGGLILAVGAVAVWLELLIRSAAIYVAVLFLPLALAGMVWPATSHWIKRLTQLLVAVILSKFVIVAILALAASGLAAAPGDGGGFGSVLAGGALLTLAAFSPMALLRMAPIVEANLAASIGGGR